MRLVSIKSCNYCEQGFIVYSSRKNRLYCSLQCSGKASNPIKVPYYSIETTCKCGCGEIFYNPDNRCRTRQFIYGHHNKNGNHPRLGVVESEEHVEQRVRAMHEHFNKKEPTSIEKQLYEYLDAVGILYEKQKQFGRTVVDAYVPELKLAIYADGLYWHSKPDHIERDNRSNERCKKLGLEVIRLPSKDNGYNLDLTKLISLVSQ